LKLTQLLADYLHSNKKLVIQGIGTFFLNSSTNSEPDPNRASKTEMQGTITFEGDHSVKTEPGLVEYISSHTGKMKALATSDLETQFELAQQFINIGKPFLFEGIGTLSKNKEGQYSFTQGNLFTERVSERAVKETAEHGEVMPDFKSVLLKDPKKINWRKPLIAVFILMGLGLVVGGGYLVYKRTSETNIPTNDETQVTEPESQTTQTPAQDTIPDRPDTTIQNTLVASTTTGSLSGSYKIVVDQFKAPRAFNRFAQLKDNGWPIKMETRDSISYKLYMLMPVATTDTTRAIDSLTALNGRRVYIEYQNK
jgi:hypothetical protein